MAEKKPERQFKVGQRIQISLSAILFAATILSARRIQESMMSNKPDMAKEFYIDRAIEEAAFILEKIDKRWPVRAGNER
jgi:hypothetical protein